jgi:hypothetical protein
MTSKSDKETKQAKTFTCTARSNQGDFFHSESDRSWVDFVNFGANNRGWKRAIARGENAATTMVGKRTKCEVFPGSLKLIYRTAFADPSDLDGINESKGVHIPGPGAGTPGADLSEADNRAKIDFLLHCKEAQTSMQGGTFLAELGETIGLVISPMRALHRRTEAFIKEQNRIARGLLRKPAKIRVRTMGKAISEGWLAYSFGISPTIHDINDGFEALSEATHPSRPFTMPVRGKGVYGTSEDLGTVSSGFPLWGTNAIGTSVAKCVRKVRYYGKFHLPVGQIPRITAQFGLTWDDVIPTVWEEIPWSFLIDYFTNIGDVLETWSVDQAALDWVNKGELTESKTIIRDIRQSREVSPGPSFKKLIYSGSPGYVNWTTTEVRRSIVNEVLHPSFTVELPGRKRLKKLANAVSLLMVSGRSRNPYARIG